MSVIIHHVNFTTGEMIVEHDGHYISLEEEEARHELRVAEVEKMKKKENQQKSKSKK